MAISINWATRVILIPQSYLTLVAGSLYELDVDQFRLDLKDIEDSEEGMSFPDTHRHVTETVLSGVTYARFVEIINGYTITFENGNYSVRCVGANHNIADVKNVNSVSLIVGNSAGLVVGGTGTAPTAMQVAEAVWTHSTGADLVTRVGIAHKVLRNKQITDPVSGEFVVYEDDGVTVFLRGNLYENAAGTQPYRGQGAERRERLV